MSSPAGKWGIGGLAPILRSTAELGAVAPEMVDGYGMAPGNVVDGDTEGTRQALTLRRAGGVIAGGDGLNELCFEPADLDQLLKACSRLFHNACNWFHESTRIRWFSLSPM